MLVAMMLEAICSHLGIGDALSQLELHQRQALVGQAGAHIGCGAGRAGTLLFHTGCNQVTCTQPLHGRMLLPVSRAGTVHPS